MKTAIKAVNLRDDKVIQKLIKEMSIEEKLRQLVGTFPNANVKRGIPHLQQGECLHGVLMNGATSFPQAIALGATWDPQIVQKAAEAIAHEARSAGIHHCYTPMLGVARDPRWGRTEEAYGEDPYLVSEIGVAFVKGLQGEEEQFLDRNHVIATAKHFVADGEPLGGRNGAPMDISERTLREIHLLPFERAVKEAKLQSIMPAHHALNGTPCHMNKRLIEDVLRNEWGFDGVVVSDNNDIKLLYTTMKVATSKADAANKALASGVDMELAWMNGWDETRYYGPTLLESIEDGTVSEKLIDRALERVLKVKGKIGLSEEEIDETMDISISKEFIILDDGNPRSYAESKKGFGTPRNDKATVFGSVEHNELALEVAKKSIILLKNDEGILPLNTNKIKKLAVIGPNADCVLLGGYSRFPNTYTTILKGIEAQVGNEVEVLYREGCTTPRRLVAQGCQNGETIACVDSPEAFLLSDVDEAEAIAREADIAVVVLGGSEATCKENQDRDSLELVGDQLALIQRIHETGTKVVCVLLHGRPNTIEWIAENIPVIVDGFYLGQQTGNAITEVLFGNYNPSGKLPITIPRTVGQVPCYYNQLIHGRRANYYNSSPEPLFAFGHGLSYSNFSLEEIKLNKELIKVGESIEIDVIIKNNSVRNGDQVVQLYVNDVIASQVRPDKELKRFERVFVEGTSTKVIKFVLDEADFRFYDGEKWVVEPGEFEIMIGFDSIQLKKCIVTLN